jgi:uncharacterized membrane protein
MLNPFDSKTVLLAKHAQHVVLVHFPIALFLTAAGSDFAAQWTKKPVLATVSRYNVMIAAIATLPVMLASCWPGNGNSKATGSRVFFCSIWCWG